MLECTQWKLCTAESRKATTFQGFLPFGVRVRIDTVDCIYAISAPHFQTGSSREFVVQSPCGRPRTLGRASLLCVDTNTTTTTRYVNTFVRVNQYPWKSNLLEISRPDGAAGFSQPDGATDTLEVTIALGRLLGAGKDFQRNFPFFKSAFFQVSNSIPVGFYMNRISFCR